jgi:3-carboxy-cis,cis-muconate cycloisomerase
MNDDHPAHAPTIGLFGSFMSRSWFPRAATEIWDDRGTLRTWLEVEATLAEAQAELGLIPKDAAATIRAHTNVEALDMDRLQRDIAFTGHQLVPVLRQLEELCGEPAAGYIHWGTTTQNIFDTAQALQMVRTHRLVLDRVGRATARLSALAKEHRLTVQAGRTHGQHALPMTFGFKVANWLAELGRDRARLEERLAPSFVAQMGGAIGTFAAFGPRGPELERLLADKLGLTPAGMPSRASSDRATDYVNALGLVAGTMQKIAQDIYFLQRNEIAEVEEAFHQGKIGSSTMAQKRNPALASWVVALARQLLARLPLVQSAMVRLDEGDCTFNNVTDVVLPEAGVLAVGLTDAFARLAENLRVHPEAMRKNAELTYGLIVSEAIMMRLTETMGRHQAHHLVYEAAQRSISENVSFLTAIREHPSLKEHGMPAGLEQALSIDAYIGESARLVDAIVDEPT